jgi:hypothetical protein
MRYKELISSDRCHHKGERMTSSDRMELEQWALFGELARPLAHECNNFLNNLFLQMAVMERELPEQFRSDWGSLRREGKKLTNLVKQWQGQPRPATKKAEKSDLNGLIQEIVAEQGLETGAISLHERLTPGPLWMARSAGDVKRLCLLMVLHALACVKADGRTECALEIQTEKERDRIVVRILAVGPKTADFKWPDPNLMEPGSTGALSLTTIAWKSLAERLGSDIRVQRVSDGRFALALDFPRADSE